MAGYGAIEQMGSEAAPQRPARSAGRAKRAKSSTGPGEGSFLYEAGLGFDKENRCRTISLLSCLVFVTIGVTAWMQTCVPFCGAKTFKTGLWKDAWNNVTIPSDMLGSMDTTVDPCQDFYQFACGGFVESTGIKGDQVKWAEETRVCVCVCCTCMHVTLVVCVCLCEVHTHTHRYTHIHTHTHIHMEWATNTRTKAHTRTHTNTHTHTGGVGQGMGRRRDPHQQGAARCSRQ